MYGAGILGAWLVVAIGGAALGALWVRRLWKKRHELPRPTKAVAGLAASAVLFGAVGTVLGLVKAFGAVGGENMDPSQKARILAEGISEAMNCTAFALLVWVPIVVVLGVVLRKRPRDRA
jgi:biopolymer transport protein ExbB/TolQ